MQRYVWFLGQIYANKSRTYRAASAPDRLYGPRFRLFLAQCAPHYAQRDNIFNVYHVSLIILIYSRAELRPTFWLIIFFWGGVALSHRIFYIQYCYGHEKSP